MAVEAGARLLERLLDALRQLLVLEHVLVAARTTVVLREGVALPHGDQPRILLDLRVGDAFARIVVRGFTGFGVVVVHLSRGDVRLVLGREVLAPHRGIVGRFVDLDDLGERRLRFLLAFEDVREECGKTSGGHRDDHQYGDRDPAGAGT